MLAEALLNSSTVKDSYARFAEEEGADPFRCSNN